MQGRQEKEIFLYITTHLALALIKSCHTNSTDLQYSQKTTVALASPLKSKIVKNLYR